MFLNNINFPNQIIDALIKQQLVVFAGAGASMEKPTCLPNFVNLTERIAEDTGKSIKKGESCEVFLGALKANGINVNEIASDILSNANLKHNALHEAIVDLFTEPAKVKIVTTNYDEMFEQVISGRGITVPVYNAPALPLGSDVSGIVHLHGNVNESKYMVVTDEDFGRAYLTDGYASRFLVRLFESYTILFVGYSYNDTILRYLTRAMSRENSVGRFILTDDTKSDWNALGISAINYPRRSYAVMRGGLVKLGNYTKKGLWDWRNLFLEIADAPPKDMTIETEIDYCLEDIDRSKVLASCIHGKEWLALLDKKGVFWPCFNDTYSVSEKDTLWAQWLCNGFLGIDDESLMWLFSQHNNRFSSLLSKLILRAIAYGNVELSDDCFKEYVALLDDQIGDYWIIIKLIEKAQNRQEYHIALQLFEKLFTGSVRLEKSIWMQGNYLEAKYDIPADYHIIHQAWELIQDKAVSLYGVEILEFVLTTIEKIHYKYYQMGKATPEKEPWQMGMLVIEDHVKEYSKEPLHVLIQGFVEASKNNSGHTKSVLQRSLLSESILMRKIALRAIRETNCFSAEERMTILCDEKMVWSVEGKEQVFLLARDSFGKASQQCQNTFLDIVEKGPSIRADERSNAYAIYNWCVWLLSTYPKHERIKQIEDRILSKYEFAPREHPELSIVEGDVEWIPEVSPISSSELLTLSLEEAKNLLVGYKPKEFDHSSREGLLMTFSKCIADNIQWGKELAVYLHNHKISDNDIWEYLIRGITEANLSIKESLSLCETVNSIIDGIPCTIQLARWLLKLMERDDIRFVFKDNEQLLYDISLAIWNMRQIAKPSEMRLIDTIYNCTTGQILLSWIYMVSYSNTVGIPDEYKVLFDRALDLKTWEREVAICVLAGHFNYFCYRDRAWCVNHFEPMLTGKNKKVFISAWTGVVYFSRRISKDTADIISSIFLKAVGNIECLEGEVKEGFMELYLTLLIHIIEKPTLKYIPYLYAHSSDKTQCRFVQLIGYRLRNMEVNDKQNWWDNWLRRFIENRKNNKPVQLDEKECQTLFMLLPRLSFVFNDAVKILCKGSLPTDIDSLLWLELEKEILPNDHSRSLATLLSKLLINVHSIGFGEQSIINLVKGISGLHTKEKIQLQEALLKHNINIVVN